MNFRADDIAAATGGRLVQQGPPGPIGTDTRRLQPGVWFLALVGDNFDGHEFLSHAAAAGCAGVVAQRVPEGWKAGFVQVPDTLRALQDLAAWVRAGFEGLVVGLTGSAGKTTTRALTALALEGLGEVYQTEGNLNNLVGVPLTILRAPMDAAAWVLEMGMNRFGEIHRLQEIGRPNIRLITNVGAAHLEGLGSLEGVAKAKGEMFAGALPDDICCVNADDPRVAAIPVPEGVRVIRFGTAPNAEVRLTDAVVDAEHLVTRFRIEVDDEVVLGQIRSPGLHLAMNAAAAVAVAFAARAPLEGLGRRLGRYEPVGMRLRLEAGPNGTRILNDAYNANPISMAASLRTLAALSGRRFALLGDMLELGSDEDRAHREILELALSLGLERVGLAGPRFTRALGALGGKGAVAAPDAVGLGDLVRDELRPGDIVLIKGSRGSRMEAALATMAGETASQEPRH